MDHCGVQRIVGFVGGGATLDVGVCFGFESRSLGRRLLGVVIIVIVIVVAAGDAVRLEDVDEAGALLERLWPYASDLLQLLSTTDAFVLLAERQNVRRRSSIQTRHFPKSKSALGACVII